MSVPIWHWKSADQEISGIKKKYDLGAAEIHTGWILREYNQQKKIEYFERLDFSKRRDEVISLRNQELLLLQKKGDSKKYKKKKKTFEKTKSYIHLTLEQRRAFIKEVASCISSWGFARLFAECIDKNHPAAVNKELNEQAFEQVVSRFEQYLEKTSADDKPNYGLLIHDHNNTVCKKHTMLMEHFHQEGTFWTSIKNIIETPLFVDSELTSMVQIADLCAYSLRRYLENNESELFNLIFARADRKPRLDGKPGPTVGVRHFTNRNCQCIICKDHKDT